ncbi:MAG: PorV/PorQ family protein [Flavobacteriales bacterium]|nr:PorV/PorQ family protein [Bacteroidota bacterium]MCB9241381.1 PorV/PorQ family protein [Flavobacteriales bacterium]
MQRLLFILALGWSTLTSAQILPNFGGQRAGLSTLSFLKNEMNPESLGMSGAGVALKGNVFSSATNPAGLTALDDFSFGLSHMTIGAGIQQSLISSQFKLKNTSTIGFQINSLNSGQMEVRTEFQPNGTGNYFSVSQSAITGNYAMKMTEMFSLGIGLKMIYENMAGYSNMTAGLDLGFLYETDFRNLRFAVVVQNFGGSSSINGSDVMVGYNRNGNVELARYTIPTTFRMGFSIDAYQKDKHLVIGAMELNNPNDNSENIRFGFEYQYAELLSVQTGYKISVKGHGYPTLGMAYKTRIGAHPMFIQYAMNPTNYMGTQHLIGLRFTRNKMER